MKTERNYYCVYGLTILYHEKVYVGTTFKIEQRIATHRRKLEKGIHGCVALQDVYNRAGKQPQLIRFEIYEAKKCTQIQAQLMEQEHIRRIGVNFVYNTHILELPTEREARLIRERRGMGVAQLARHFNITQNTVENILANRIFYDPSYRSE